jgi:ubiquinone/menaquinone biosynthesis C-methylase UbiE
MLDIATRRANSQGITNFETKVCSADDLPFGDSTFDSISVRFGYMFFPDFAKATAEFARVLKPGGRLCRRYGSSPRKIRGRRSPCRQSPRSGADTTDPDGPTMFRRFASRTFETVFA